LLLGALLFSPIFRRKILWNWPQEDGKSFDNYYGLDFSKEDAKSSEGPSFYVLLIVYPQTYLRTNIKLRNSKNHKTQFFYLVYTDSITNRDIGNYSDRSNVPAVTDERSFQTKVVEIKKQSVLSESEKAIIEFIKKDFSKTTKRSVHSLSFIKSNQHIPIDLTDFLADIIRGQYIKGFSFSDPSQVKQYKETISRVQDSLRQESDRLNSLCEIKNEAAVEIQQSPHIIYLFFSSECNDMIYVQVVGSRGITIAKNRYRIIGPADTYLFQMSNDRIQTVYRGLIAFD
jgi:hypothetical protein